MTIVERQAHQSVIRPDLTGREKSSPAEKPTPLEARILKNFYLSFKFSQGRVPIQINLMSAILHQYQKSEILDEFGSVSGLNKRLGSRVEKLSPPRSHTKVTEAGEKLTTTAKKNEIKKQWARHLFLLSLVTDDFDSYFHKLDDQDNLVTTYVAPDEERVLAITKEMLKRDIELIRGGRPERQEGEDPYESFVKTYAIDKESTGSVEFNAVFEQIGTEVSAALSSKDKEEASDINKLAFWSARLKKEWEEKHPGQSFVS